jgi:hypothetical protein
VSAVDRERRRRDVDNTTAVWTVGYCVLFQYYAMPIGVIASFKYKPFGLTLLTAQACFPKMIYTCRVATSGTTGLEI